jgi:hypothetical protein
MGTIALVQRRLRAAHLPAEAAATETSATGAAG